MTIFAATPRRPSPGPQVRRTRCPSRGACPIPRGNNQAELLERQTLTGPDGCGAVGKQALLRGQDEIALTMEYAAAIEAHESRRASEMPWLT
jgi:hypothetical protein